MNTLFLLAGASGATAHILFYRLGEWDLKSLSLVTNYLIFVVIGIYIESLNVLDPYFPAPLERYWAIKSVGCHVVGIYLSIILYRLFWHRLSRFPGPFFAKLSNFYVTALSAKKLHLYEEVENLHKKYGDYVRLGPSELSIADPQAVKYIYGGQAKVRKGPWYTVLEPRVSLHMSRDKQEHARRRKVWDQAFSSKSLRNYEPRVSHYTNQLIGAIQKNIDKPMNMSNWFNYYSFDVMGDLSFGKSFNMLLDGKETYFLKQLHADMKMIGIFSHLTWLFPFFKRIPLINADYLKMWNWVRNRVKERTESKPDCPDVFSWVLDDFDKGPKTKQDQLNLEGDGYLIVVAGSDTTAATLTNLFFHLAGNPHWQKLLQEELDALPDLSYEKLVNIKNLDALINETLRLHPAVPSGTQRMTPPEGISIGDVYIPGDIMVCMPPHTLFRDQRVFSRPEEFVPERWTTQPELVKEPSAFIPFNSGPYSCVGKQLALMELRHVTAQIVTQFDIFFAPSQKVNDFIDGKRDTFTLVTAPLQLVFRERKKNVT
ncbi:cytochrome P450 monooxygenase [Talaromyces proteolyticus]|uniref:Cytochrome P450 monooxygenase n=1 Tax=Talaromyces proteolyticus TaxID=1131652 RepID=A0AAD4L8W7_9EURO|nr:cytochrome P450 monooxygenase [Talaromyces proteolyticus]KAH8706024.1 cytochrome P450 monooxygenase [Talaromyces proteolyticus]